MIINYTLRPVVSADNSALAKMIRGVFEEYKAPKEGTVYADASTDDLYALFQEASRAILWVAELEGQPVGCCGIYPTTGLAEDCVELVKFYLAAGARGQGIGKALLAQCIGSAKELGYKQVYLESLPIFNQAVTMYEKQGFVTLTTPKGQSGHGSCSVWMLKKL